MMWACLAGAAVHIGHLVTAQEAYASLEESDRVSHLQYILNITNPALRSAEMYLMAGHSVDQVEGLLVRAGMTYRAIMLNIQFCNWERALQLAKKQKIHIEIVLYFRSKYLKKSEQMEGLESFIKAMKAYEEETGSTEISTKKVKEDIQAEQEKERLKSEQHSDVR
ncbi:hypothetical protein J437_LFUL019619 [Ladona fulva]|nr:hypothetical protein J437_LFUL019619 [Ladona fulva]